MDVCVPDIVEERARTHVHGSAAEHASDSAGLHTYNTGESIHATRHVNMVLLCGSLLPLLKTH